MKTMISAVLVSPGKVALQEVALPEVGPDSVRVRLEGCGVGGSNLPAWEGRPWFNYPMAPGAPGHEGWGIVDRVGEQVDHLRTGDRVAFLSSNAFAEYDVAHAAHAVRLPDKFDGQAFPGEALGCAMNVLRRSAILPQQTVAIVGSGFLGALLVTLASRVGARVIAVSRRSSALEVARRMGARETIVWDDSKRVAELVKTLTRGAGCERVIEATGHQGALDLATEITQERGRLIIAGYHQDGPRQVNMRLWNWRGIDVINAHERSPQAYVDGMRAAIEAILNGQMDPRPLYTHSFRLDRLPCALESLRTRPPEFLKALITYD